MSEKGQLEVGITGNASGFRQVLNGVKAQAGQFSKELDAGLSHSWGGIGKSMVGGIVGALSFESVKGFFGDMFNRAGEIKEVAEQFDISTDALQEWEKAAQRAGVTATTFYRALETLRQKRQEAREDPKKAEAFDEIGLGNQARGPEKDVELLRQILESGASRPQLKDLLGPRGARLKASLPFLGGEPMFSEKDIENAAQIKQAGVTFWGSVKAFGLKLFTDPLSLPWQPTFGSATAPEYNKDFQRLATEKRDAEKKAHEERDRKEAEEDAKAAEQLAADRKLQVDVAKESEEKVKRVEIEERLRDAKRKNMTTGARRASLQSELANVDSKIEHLKPFFDILGESDKARLAGYEIQHETLTGELRKKPIELGADGIAKSGLFSGAALNFSMGDGTQKAQLDVQRQMLRELQARHDPHQL
jgi:hypothetical protein